MTKNKYILDNIDCAACGIKIEDEVRKLDGIKSSYFNFMLMKLDVEFDEEVLSDEDIEKTIHKPVTGVKIIEKNGEEFNDLYESPKMFKKIMFRGKRK